MLKRRVPRVLVSGFLLAVAVSGLSACRTSPNVAAYVGDSQVTVTELDSAVADRLADENIAAYAEGNEEEFTRRVLSLLVQEEVYAAAAERYDLQVGNSAVRTRISDLLGDDDPDDVYSQLAQQGIGRDDVFENVRQSLVRRGIAEAEGEPDGLDPAALQARYAEVREDLAQVSFGYIVVPDDATAAGVLAQLTADPASYPALAAQYPRLSLPTVEARSPEEVPAALAEGIAAAAPNTGFAGPVADVEGVVVTFVAGKVYPPFEEVRPQLEKEATTAIDAVANEVLEDVRNDVGVTVNPRYGVLEDGKLVAGGGGVVDILGDDAASTATDPAATPAG
ncbi:SurA N-terminal domain-containing protein [Blastococcus sp. CT_GayMR16]|uniref:SurA N-terminal domain-containing protein n=1 Tax=Blastococcus sp. CT_GayMR16 TaxID=2559607 RepID=UPI0014313B98|nr:SurA N-terminal domain-containing protein [Blastococcus sp. CT_GayMR16]